jgi:hypothetical protein|nr:MAG TPA: RNA polymerase alpha subunit [Caudoviricetes sp.]
MLLDNYLNKLKEELSEKEYKLLIDMVNEDISYNHIKFEKKPTENEILEICKIAYKIISKYR